MNGLKKTYPYLIRYLFGGLLFGLGAFFSMKEQPVLSCGLFILLMIFECVLLFLETKTLLDFRLLFSLTWLTGIGLSCLKLSALQTDFLPMTWVCLGLFYFLVLLPFDLFLLLKKKRKPVILTDEMSPLFLKRVEISCYAVAAVGLLGFLIESIVFQFQYPIFVRNTSHAYTDFHLTGISYFVYSLFFVHVLTILLFIRGDLSNRKKLFLLVLNGICFLVPILLLSKLQILISILMPSIVFLLLKKLSKKQLLLGGIGALLCIVLLFVLVVLKRDYPAGFLEETFRFYDQKTPVFFQYIYIYIVNNFENVNVLVRELSDFSYGIRFLVPFLSMTGLKFIPAVATFMGTPARFFTQETLTTTTILYDAYGDFSIFGVGMLAILLGCVCVYIQNHLYRKDHLFSLLFYPQMAFYLFMAFFTTWFSNPTVWFWLFLTILLSFYCQGNIQNFFQHLSKRSVHENHH